MREYIMTKSAAGFDAGERVRLGAGMARALAESHAIKPAPTEPLETKPAPPAARETKKARTK